MINKFADLHNFNLCRQRGPAPAPAGGATSLLVHWAVSRGGPHPHQTSVAAMCVQKCLSVVVACASDDWLMDESAVWWTSIQMKTYFFETKKALLAMAQKQETLMYVSILYKQYKKKLPTVFRFSLYKVQLPTLSSYNLTSALHSYYGMVMYCSSGNKVICML